MTLYEFRLLTPIFQLQHVLSEGAYLAHRWAGVEDRINLYHVPDGGRGFFIELGYDDAQVELLVLRSFSSAVPLADYAHYVRLPEW